MKNEETGRISYYTSKKEVVYTSLMMCENAPPEWLHVPEENIKMCIRDRWRMYEEENNAYCFFGANNCCFICVVLF